MFFLYTHTHIYIYIGDYLFGDEKTYPLLILGIAIIIHNPRTGNPEKKQKHRIKWNDKTW